ncbi:MAG: hypothetical protein ACRECO_18560 [Xanthobacteraceae bacterium]
MVSEIEARACRVDLMTPPDLLPQGRALGPLVAWAVFYGLVIIGGFLAN